MKAVLKTFNKAVTAAGTAEALTTSDIDTKEVIIKAPAGNAGAVYIGDSTVAAANGYILAAGDTITLTDLLANSNEDVKFALSDIYVDAANNGDAVVVIYLERARD